ncbi:exopolysaccharide production protein ExoY (plasmid) [Sinorhizobium fredii NGR234]|uniref:Exopolysaccharide production protein ExoY n=1 Tax=Sinorhizobium fredii (strain NBRC 101917 / NGR234) TaxID=394 RepID=C3KRX6_SINFN|nr:sugar transferase [Sinorhizobium fredii]ACP22834.1 exopolysaccharide production protein ExoY [Sinorhizobium fredii NGR234]
MTANTPDIHPFRRRTVSRNSGGSPALITVRHFLFPGVDSREWSSSKRTYRLGFDFSTRTAAAAENQAAATGPAQEQYVGPLGKWPKRALDLTVASVALILAMPLMLIVALLVAVMIGRPILFVHRRIGFNGRPFDCYKFRTMVENADKVLEEYLARNPRAAEEWRATQKLKHDPRVTLLGKILRKSSLDELPQLMNVLRGEMSCVGPRPIVAEELCRYGSTAEEYLKTRPGLTGLWQISGRNDVDYSRRVALDAQYVRSWSILSDLAILARTAVAVMRFDQAS